MSDRIFTQAEVSELLAKAARLEGVAVKRPSGLTLAEVKDAARAAGIDPSWVETALKTTGETREPKSYAGITTSVHRERVLPNPIDENQWGRIVAELRRSLGGKGTAESIGGNRAWERAPLRVVIENVDGRAIVNADGEWASDVKGTVWSAVSAVAATLFFGAAAFDTRMPPLVFFSSVLALVSVFAVVTLWRYRKKAPRVGDKLDSALDQVEQLSKPERATSSRTFGVSDPAPQVAVESEPQGKVKSILDGAVGYWQGDSAGPGKSRERG